MAQEDGRMSESPDPELVYAEAAARSVMRISEGNDNPARVIFGPLLAEIDRLRAQLEPPPETWVVVCLGTHERLVEFSDYDEAIACARELHRGGVWSHVMTARNAPDPRPVTRRPS